jgi:hypothetical protein
MVDQAQINETNSRDELPPQAVARSTAEFLHDVATLAELQGRLVVIDFREGTAKLLTPVILLVIGIAVALGCVPIALVALATTLMEFARLSAAASFGIALLVGLLLAGVLTAVSIGALKRSLNMFERSLYEWSRNVKWVKDTLRRLGEMPRRYAASSQQTGRW